MEPKPVEEKIPNLAEQVHAMLMNQKKAKFVESVEIQILLCNYNPRTSRRIRLNVLLPHERRHKTKACLIGDAEHIEEAKTYLCEKIDVVDFEFLKSFNKVKKKIKKWAKRYHYFLCSESIVRKVPRLLGPMLSKLKKFPKIISHDKPLEKAIEEQNRVASFRIFVSEPNIFEVVGNVLLSEAQIEENITTVLEKIIETVPKRWGNIKSIHIKTTMGVPVKIY